MKILKVFATSILGFLLFISLSIFGVLFTLNQTILNPNFISSILDEVDVAATAEEVITEEEVMEGLSPEVETVIFDTIAAVEPVVKEGIGDIVIPIYDYLKDKSDSIDLAQAVRENLLSSEFTTSLLADLDISSLAETVISEQDHFGEDFPDELLDTMVDTIDDFEPTLKEELTAAADPVFSYLLWESQSIDLKSIMEPILSELEDAMRDAISESAPPEIAELSPAELDELIDELLSEMILATIDHDETLLEDIPTQIDKALTIVEGQLGQVKQDIAKALADAEEQLEELKEYIGYFRLGYMSLMGVIPVLIIGIILLNLQVRSATYKLGSIFTTYGAIELAALLISKHFGLEQVPNLIRDIPDFAQELILQLANDVLAPLQSWLIGCLVVGVALLVISFVYKRHQAEAEGEGEE